MAIVQKAHEHWSSRFAFLMAAVGFAVGLGNIWRFPYIAGENGGAAFVIVYLGCAFLIGAPILMAELLIGRRGQGSAVFSMREVARINGRSPQWQWVGGMGLLAAYSISIVYSVVVGWVLWYLFKALTTGFVGVDASGAEQEFLAVQASIGGMGLWNLIGLTVVGIIIYAGVKNGIERAVVLLMPMLFVLLIVLTVYNVFAGGFEEAIEWLFTPDFSKITGKTLLAAIGQAFFSIGVAMGGMMTFGAYLDRDVSIAGSAAIIVIADTAVALLAGLVIFPAVFANGLDPAAGAGLIFQTLPVAFAQMPAGQLFAIAFFLLLSVAGITSMVGLIESVTSYMEEHRGMSRHRSTLLVVGSVAVLNILSILSYNLLSHVRLFGADFNTIVSYFSDQVLLPVGGLLIALFVGWFLPRRVSEEELAMQGLMFKGWYFSIRYVVPPAVFIIFVVGIFGLG